MKLSDIATNVMKFAKGNSPELLTGTAVVGLGATVYFTVRGSMVAARVIDEHEGVHGTASERKNRVKERTKLTWKFFVPAGVSATTTAVCIIGASKASSRRTAAAVTAYSLGEKAFSEYREKVAEQIGKNKEQRIRDEVAQDRINNNKPKEIIITGKGEVLCCEMMTGRYFKSDMETLRKAQNDINAKINNQYYVSMDEFYDIVGLPHTSQSDLLGWDSEKQMELKFTTTLSPSGEPCLAFDYNYSKKL